VTRSPALLLALCAPAAAEPCPPHARLSGDPAAVASVGVELTKLGVVVSDAPSTCRTIDATVELGPSGGYAIAVQHGGQSEGRTVGDAAVAATWLDSWLVDDFGGPTFSAKLASAPIVMRPQPVTEAEAYADTKIAPRLGVAVFAALDQAWTFDRARWTGISAGACAQVGRLCFGATGRYATQSMLVGQTAAARSDLSVLATASVTSQVGRFQVVPELGLGVGRMTTKRVDGCRVVPACDPADPHCSLPPVDPECAERDQEHAYALRLDDDYHVSSVTPRARASVKLAVALADHLWLDGVAAVMVSPFDHDDPYGLPNATPAPFGVPMDQLALPGEPLGTFELGIGLRWGTP
jgi:hypothetical protein